MPRRIAMCCKPLEHRTTPDATPHNLAVSNFYQNWNDAGLITVNDNWSGVPSVVGFLGDDTFGEGVDPQTVLTPYSTVNLIANQGNNTTLTDGGVAEFDGLVFPATTVVALQADAIADAPNLVVSINTTGRSNVVVSYKLRDLDGTADDAIQPVALQYRVGNAGDFMNLPNGFVADATTGPSLATKLTPVKVTLPSAVDNQPLIQVRIITTNGVGVDEWVGIEDIVIATKEFALHSHTFSYQRSPAVAMDVDGDVVAVWESAQDGNGYGIYGQRFNAQGTKVGSEFLINTFTTGNQFRPSVSMDANGNAFIVWEGHGNQDGEGYGIFGQRFNAAGMKIGTEVQINTHTTNHQQYPSVAVDADGDVLVTWQSYHGGSGQDIYAQRLDVNDMKIGGEFRVNNYSGSNQSNPYVAVDADGMAMVAWQSGGKSGSGSYIYGQRLDSLGAKVGSELQVNTIQGISESSPAISLDANGLAFVVWEKSDDGGGRGISGQRFDTLGNKVGGEIKVNTTTLYYQQAPSVAIDSDGDALVTWNSDVQDGNGFGIYGQRFNSMGAKVGSEFQLNTYTTFHQSSPMVAMDATGNAMVVWQSNGQNPADRGVFGQRFRSPNPPSRFTDLQINNGSPQRSLVTSLQINFDNALTFVGSPSSAFTLVNQKTTIPVALAAVVDPGGKSVTLTFTGGSVDLGGSLADGLYTLTILGNQFTGNGFDGNGDGITGDNYTMIGTPANGLFRLFGDADGNGSVSATDFNAFRLVYGTAGPSFFDFDNDGQVSASDFNQFRLRYGIALTP